MVNEQQNTPSESTPKETLPEPTKAKKRVKKVSVKATGTFHIPGRRIEVHETAKVSESRADFLFKNGLAKPVKVTVKKG